MRGYYRAVKRGEKWALDIAKYPRGTPAWMMAYYYRDIDWAAEMRKPGIFDRIPKGDWSGGTLTVPLTMGYEAKPVKSSWFRKFFR